MSNNGRMGPVQNEQSQYKYCASLISADMILVMIYNPEGETNSSPMMGIWIVCSFVTRITHSTPAYNVVVNNDIHIDSCTCADFMCRRAPCKHMYLLRNFTSMQLHYEINQENVIDMIEVGTIQSNELVEHNIIQELSIETVPTATNSDDVIKMINTTEDNLQFVAQTLHPCIIIAIILSIC